MPGLVQADNALSNGSARQFHGRPVGTAGSAAGQATILAPQHDPFAPTAGWGEPGLEPGWLAEPEAPHIPLRAPGQWPEPRPEVLDATVFPPARRRPRHVLTRAAQAMLRAGWRGVHPLEKTPWLAGFPAQDLQLLRRAFREATPPSCWRSRAAALAHLESLLASWPVHRLEEIRGLHVFLGAAGTGKTTLALRLARALARAGRSVGLVSLISTPVGSRAHPKTPAGGALGPHATGFPYTGADGTTAAATRTDAAIGTAPAPIDTAPAPVDTATATVDTITAAIDSATAASTAAISVAISDADELASVLQRLARCDTVLVDTPCALAHAVTLWRLLQLPRLRHPSAVLHFCTCLYHDRGLRARELALAGVFAADFLALTRLDWGPGPGALASLRLHSHLRPSFASAGPDRLDLLVGGPRALLAALARVAR